MKTGKITAKLRDAVAVCLMGNGILPATFPALRAKMTRTEKAAANAARISNEFSRLHKKIALRFGGRGLYQTL